MPKYLTRLELIVLACSLAIAADNVPTQAISGNVVTQDGSVPPNVSVQAVPIGGTGNIGTQVWKPADKEGRFKILLRPGRYQIRARAEGSGYPDPNFLFSVDGTASFPTVTVTDHKISDVHVVLGSKGAILEGVVRDLTTGSPIPKAKITISDADRPQAFVEVFTNAAGEFQFTVPIKPIVVQATAARYNSSSLYKGEKFTLSAGERRDIDIQLEPANP